MGAYAARIDEGTAGARDFGIDRGIAVVRAVAEVTGQRVERPIDRRIQTTPAAGGGSRMFRLVADGFNGRREEVFEVRVVDQRRGQHEAALRPAHPEESPPDEWLLCWEVQLPLLHGRKDASRFSAPDSVGSWSRSPVADRLPKAAQRVIAGEEPTSTSSSGGSRSRASM